MVRYKGTDQLLFQYLEQTEANYGNKASGAYTLKNLGFVQEMVPLYDPELSPVHVLRTGSDAGIPIRILSKRENVKLRVSWLQPTLTSYVHKELFTDKENLYAVLRVYRDASNYFFVDFTGLKCDVLTIRGSIGEPLTWIMEMIGQAMDTPAALPGTPTFEDEPTGDPWEWDDCYLQYDSGGGLTLFSDVTDFEIRVTLGLKPVFVFDSTGSKKLVALEQTVINPSARITANLQSETQLDWLLAQTEVDLKLVLPDSKHITLSDGKFRAVEPTFKAGEELIAQRLDFIAKSWSHGFA